MAAIVALLAATGMVWLTSMSGHHVTSGDEAGQVVIDTVNVFDDLPGAQPPVQVSTATVTNTSGSAVHITDVEFSRNLPDGGGEGINAIGASDSSEPTTTTGPPPIPFDIFPGENCDGATVQPMQNCMISVRYTIPETSFEGTVVVTFDDGSQVSGDLGANQRALNSIVADPYVVDFGTRKVGTTSPTQTVTISASPDDTAYDIVAVSVVDTVPTPGDKADYAILSDGCTGQDLQLPEVIDIARADVTPSATADGPVANCPIDITDTPGGVGARPAFLNVSYCNDNTGGVAEGPALQFPQPQADASGAPSDSASASETPTTTAPPPPPDPEVFCPNDPRQESFHQLVAMNGAGEGTSTTTPPPTTTTTPPPPPTTTTPPVFTPTLTATPPLAPAGRTTLVSGKGFPINTPVVFALVALGTPPDSDLTNVPALVKTQTDGSGNFNNQVMLIMPHLPPGQYEILAQAQIGKSPVTAAVNFLVAPGSQEPPKFAGRH